MRIALAVVVLAAACARESQPDTPQVLSARTGLTALPAAKLAVGEACGQVETANDACASGLCLRVLPGIPPTGFCSIRCKPDDDDACPDGPDEPWACAALFPSPDGWACVPPKRWKGGRATVKGGPVPIKVPPMAVATGPVADGGGAP